MEHCKKSEEEQMKEFMKHRVKVERYADVEKQLQKIDGKEKK
jgi:hypothetical protein